MKRIGLLIVGIMIFITGCDKGRYVDIPKGYVKSEEYFDKEGIQDSSDYAKYIYNDEKVIVNDDKYKKISSDDIENIRSYFDDFYGVIRLEGIYDFDTSIIDLLTETNYLDKNIFELNKKIEQKFIINYEDLIK